MATKMIELEYLPVDSLKPYDNNARGHSEKDISAIVASIKEFGFDDPIGVWGKDNLIVEGHGRLLAAKKLGMDKVPVIHLDHLTDAQRRAYALAHNKTAELSSWLDEVLTEELNDLSEFDMSAFGFDDLEIDSVDDDLDSCIYSKKFKVPQYEPVGEMPQISDLLDEEKSKELIDEINNSGLPDDEKEFLRCAAYRHNVFNYRNIAEYYAHASKEMQTLMEKSALVIIDVNDAIANGYVKLTNTVMDLISGGGNNEG